MNYLEFGKKVSLFSEEDLKPAKKHRKVKYKKEFGRQIPLTQPISF